MKESQQKKVFTDATEEENDKEEKTEQTKIEEQFKDIKRNSNVNQEKANNEMDKHENSSTRSWEDSCRDYLTLPMLPDLNIQRRTIGALDAKICL